MENSLFEAGYSAYRCEWARRRVGRPRGIAMALTSLAAAFVLVISGTEAHAAQTSNPITAQGSGENLTALATDIQALEAMIPAMVSAWAAKDASAYSAQFTTDAEHVNAYGMWWRGRAEIEAGIGIALTMVYPDNPIAARDVNVVMIGPDAAVVQYRWQLQPYADRDGTAYADPQGRVTQVVIRQPEGWRIKFFQSTFINPNVPQQR